MVTLALGSFKSSLSDSKVIPEWRTTCFRSFCLREISLKLADGSDPFNRGGMTLKGKVALFR